jgi:hypothetical protein
MSVFSALFILELIGYFMYSLDGIYSLGDIVYFSCMN